MSSHTYQSAFNADTGSANGSGSASEECFGWLKPSALVRKVRHRGIEKVAWIFTFAAAAYNLVRMRDLLARPVGAV
jgi:hypothetical protein